ncbi:unnamed protein product [Phaedon cochleariae]|uniref:Uncharacterized protein n=1 Tax=Phaedon cochleariae TaxID=80249 RepID=A0A9N9WXX5_PHACE|nr:unnamed protein product [Phaedon cochleariae]
MCTINRTGGRLFGPEGCQVPIGKGICGETRTLDIINEFKRLYEEKMKEIDNNGGGDSLQEKIKLQQDWIGDLTDQNEMLVRAVEELEVEATERVHMLEEKLQQSAKCIGEVMKRYRENDMTNDLLKEPQEKIFHLENDKKNLLEFIRRIRVENEWSMGGLTFFQITHRDLFGDENGEDFWKEKCDRYLICDNEKEEKKIKDRECTIRELHLKLGDVNELSKELQTKKQECDALQKNLIDVRQALTEEVASKHDTILKLKKDYQELEDRCIQADKQTAFRDDIIKELRKEIKQLKQQVTCDEIGKLNSTIEELHNTLQKTKRVQEDEDKKKANTIDILNNRLIELESSLKEAEEKVRVCKICRGRSRVGFADTSEVQTDQTVVYSDAVAMLQDRDEMILSQSETLNMFQHELQTLKNKESELRRETENYHMETEYLKNTINELEKARNNDSVIDDRGLEKLMESIQNRDEIIKNQNETLILIQQELELSKKQDSDMNSEREKYCCNIELLKQRIEELESSLKYAEGRADNLQTAVNLYVNSLNVMEATEEKYKIEIDQQRATIINLQSVLVSTKQELDYLRHKSEENSMDEQKRVSRYISLMTASRIENENLQTLCGDLLVEYKKLEELNLTVEIEYCNNLQDVDELDYQLFKYQYEIKLNEEENGQYKNSLKKLMKQKKCYEEIIVYFKHEMGLMSEQLQNLQDLLNLSNESAQEEHSKLAQAFMNVQTLNQQLSTQLTAAEQKVLLENQMNQLHEVKICELERLVSEKEVDLSRHDQAILDIRQTLQDSLKQNEDSHRTILSLNETIGKLQHAVNKYETDNCMSRESNENCQLQINSCKEKLVELKDALERKTSELCKLEMAYNNQNRTLQSAQIEMKEMKERQKSKQCHMKCIIEELKDKLAQYEGKHKGLLEELKQLQTQLGIVTRKDAVKEVEIKRYRKIIGDLKRTLIELNRSLSRKNVKFESRCNNEECRKYMAQSEELRDQQETPPTCPCEVEFYQSIVETLKKSVIDLKKKLAETQKKNQELEEDQKFKESQFADISKSQMECNILKQKLMERLKQAQAEETRYSEMANQFERELASLRQELEVKTIQLDECKKSAQEINSCRCVQLACAEEEASALKEELNNLLRKHCALNVENEKLHSQSARMQSTVVSLEEKSQLLKGQVEQYLLELQMVQNEKESLLEKNRDLLNELRSLQSSYHSAGKQQRYNSEAVKILELELNEIKNNRDEICFESKNVINYFRNWLQEQRKINQHVIAKERDFRETIETLKQENEELRFQLHPQVQRQCVRNTSCIRSATPPPACQSPWSLGSQGTASVHEESPSRSPCLNEECDWFSQSFRNESEDDEEDWVTKVEDLAAQVRRTNRMWKNKMGNSDYMVTRDPKK